MKRSTLAIAFSVLAIALLPYVILAFFAVPAADDFYQANHSLEHGVFGYVQWRYLNWNGRYMADFLVALYNVLGHQLSSLFLWRYYYIAPLFLMGFYAFTNYLFSFILLRERRFSVGLIYGVLALISALGNTEVRSTFFWLAGGIAYPLANALFILLVALVTHYLYLKSSQWILGISLALIPIINGLSETVMVTYTIFILGLSLMDTILRKDQLEFLSEKIIWSSVAIISALIVYVAPGNYVRAPGFDQVEINYITLLWDTAVFSLMKIFHWMSPFWIALTLIIIVLSQSAPNRQTVVDIFKDKRNVITLACSLLLTFYTSYLVRFYILGGYRPLQKC